MPSECECYIYLLYKITFIRSKKKKQLCSADMVDFGI